MAARGTDIAASTQHRKSAASGIGHLAWPLRLGCARPVARSAIKEAQMTARSRHRSLWIHLAAVVAGLLLLSPAAHAAGVGPVEGGALPGPLPLFPADNWWNTDVSAAPVDPGSAAFVAFINNGGTRKLHPDFGGEVSAGSVQVYGMPYAVVDGTQPKVTVRFLAYGSESDGVGVPFYPIPTQAITQPHWIEGGDPGNVDRRGTQDRHLLVVDRDNTLLYELYHVYYNTTTGSWEADSGAFWDMKTNGRRPDGWTSADAAGLAILPGLVRYDEVYDPAVTEIQHAFRVTVRTTNGYVYPASHRAGSTAGALPMGARLRLKASKDISAFSPEMQKIFRAMKRYGLIVADNGSDMYITGTFDTRWNNDVLNPAFAALTASDFEVVQLGWKPSTSAPVALTGVGVNPSSVVGGASSTGTVILSGGAPTSVALTLSSANTAVATVPPSVTVQAGASSASFAVATSAVTTTQVVGLTASLSGTDKTTAITVTPPPPPPAPTIGSLTLNPTSVARGKSSVGTVMLTAPAPSNGLVVTLTSSKPTQASVPSSVTVNAGQTTAMVVVSTSPSAGNGTVTISASTNGTTKTATLTIKRK